MSKIIKFILDFIDNLFKKKVVKKYNMALKKNKNKQSVANMADCTAIVINFLREPYLWKCVESLRLTYPKIKIIVGENGEYTEEKKKKLATFGADYVKVEFDGGVCKGRNVLVDKVKTKYVLVGDDDFLYSRQANVDGMVGLLQKNDDIDLVGGRVFEKGVLRNYQGFIKRDDNAFIYTALDIEGGYNDDVIRYKQCDITFNFFVARTEVVKNTLWDENIKVAYEHSDFFLSLQAKNRKVVFTPDAIVIHKPDISETIPEDYSAYRKRKSDKEYFFTKHNLDYAIDMRGYKDTLPKGEIKEVDFLIKTFMRYDSLERLLFSIAKFYPNANIYIADDNKKFDKKYYLDLYQRLFKAGLKNKPNAYNLGYDIGLSASRNYLVQNSYSEYKLLLDDDFVFTAETKIDEFIDVLDKHPEVGVVGGALRQDGNIRHYEGWLDIKGKTLTYTPLDNEKLKRFNYSDIVFNFALFRNDVFKEIKWDKEFKISGEHTDFYLRLKKTKWKVVYCPYVIVSHIQNLPPEYKKMRARSEFYPLLFNKHNINKIISFNGLVYTKDGPATITKTRI